MKKLFLLIFLIFVTNCSSIINKKKRMITIIGKAENAKAGAIVISNEDQKMYYLDSISFWNSNIKGKLIKVKGELDEVIFGDQKEGEPIRQGISGLKRTILNPKWELIVEGNDKD